MKSDFPTRDTIRKYLLGRLDDQPDVETRLGEEMLFNDELSESADLIEDEIIEDYLNGTLSPTDKRTVEEYFLGPAERKEKLELERLLRSHFDTTTNALVKKKLNAARESGVNTEDRSTHASSFRWVFQVRTWCEVAVVALLISAGVIYLSGVRDRFQSQIEANRKTQKQLEDELAQERERSENLTKQLDSLQPPIASLAFLGPIFRTAGSIPVVQIRPWTQQIQVELDLQGAKSSAYDVHLENEARKTIWSQSGLTASSGGLHFEMPAQRLSTGTYCLVVSSLPQPYCFQASVLNKPNP